MHAVTVPPANLEADRRELVTRATARPAPGDPDRPARGSSEDDAAASTSQGAARTRHRSGAPGRRATRPHAASGDRIARGSAPFAGATGGGILPAEYGSPSAPREAGRRPLPAALVDRFATRHGRGRPGRRHTLSASSRPRRDGRTRGSLRASAAAPRRDPQRRAPGRRTCAGGLPWRCRGHARPSRRYGPDRAGRSTRGRVAARSSAEAGRGMRRGRHLAGPWCPTARASPPCAPSSARPARR